MRTILPVIAIATTGLALSACGGEPDHPPHGMTMPPASPSIQFKVGDNNGNTLELDIECGAKTPLKECAKINESIIERVAKMRAQNTRSR